MLLIEIVVFLFVFTFNKQDIMAPSVMVSLVFIFSTLLVLYNGHKWNIDFSFSSTAILSLGIVLFGVTDVIVGNTVKSKRRINIQLKTEPLHFKNWKIIALIIVDIVIVYLVYREVLRIASTNTWFSNIFYAYRVITSHSEGLSPDQYMKGYVNQLMKVVIVSGFICAGAFINNVLVCKEKLKSNLLLIIPPVLMCLMTLFTGVRTNILRLLVFCLIFGYILLQTKKQWRIKTSWRFIRILAVSVVVMFVAFGFLQSFLGRAGSTDIVSVVSNYAGAPIMHFDQYIQDPPAKNEVFGQETLTGIWNLLYKLGFTSEVYSGHKEYRYITQTDYGNVYTIFRSFIQDFGVFGMAFMTVLTSAIFSYLYNHSIKYKPLTYKRVILIIEYSYMYHIVAMASIDNLVHDYLSLGTVILVVVLHAMMWVLTRKGKKIALPNGRRLKDHQGISR